VPENPVGCLPLLIVPAALVGEFYVLAWVAGQIGWLWAILALIGSMSLGGTLVRIAGLQAMVSARESMRRGEGLGRSMFDGACLLAAGALFVFPGFATDAVAILLLLPPVRWALFHLLGGRAGRGAMAGAGPFGGAGPQGGGFSRGPGVFVWTWSAGRPGGRGAPGGPAHPRTGGGPGGVIDAEWTEVRDGPPGDQRALPGGNAGDSTRSNTRT